MNKYSYPEIILWLEKKGIELYDNHFQIVETDYPIIYKLIAYFLKDEPTCFQDGINLNKDLKLKGGLPVAVRYKKQLIMNTTLSYLKIIDWLEKKGIELYGNHFKIFESDYPIIYKLIAYFLKDI